MNAVCSMSSINYSAPLCGLWYHSARPPNPYSPQASQPVCLPQLGMKAHTVIKDVASRTILTQTFYNGTNEHLKTTAYSFPLYDGVTVVSFKATIGDVQIHGSVKEKQQARREYRNAVDKGTKAGLLEQLQEASDVFITNLGSIPAGATVIVEVTYIGELRHDAESNGIRFTIPSSIAPRYGPTPGDMAPSSTLRTPTDAIGVVVDFESPEGSSIQKIQSSSHPIAINIGRTTSMATTAHMANRGSATLSLDIPFLDRDFVFIACIKDANSPKALLETHATIPKQRALMATLVPRFNITPSYGEIVFIVDRSGSMEVIIGAMTVMLKSLPIGTKFNICSFGSTHSFLWRRSKSYNDTTLNEALNHIDTFNANLGGTEMRSPVQATIAQRFSDMLLDVIILTDGQIWNQESLFNMVKKASEDYKCRFFSLGIGSGASTALVEGIATAGNGFSQFVAEGERIDTKMVRLLKGALTPHIDDYSLEIKYKQDDDFEMIESIGEASKVNITAPATVMSQKAPKTSTSFFSDVDSDGDTAITVPETSSNNFTYLPAISSPSIIQAPCQIPALYSFSRTTVYMMLDPDTYHRTPEAIVLRATCSDGPLELEINVEDIGKGETIHQLAAKKAVSELEKNGGWLSSATDKTDSTLIKNKYDCHWEEIVEREAVRLGVKYQIAGKWTSFLAVEEDAEYEAVIITAQLPRTYVRNSNLAQRQDPSDIVQHQDFQALADLYSSNTPGRYMAWPDSVCRKSKADGTTDSDFVASAAMACLATPSYQCRIDTRADFSSSLGLEAEVLGPSRIDTPPATTRLQSSASYSIRRGLDSGVDLYHIVRLQKSDGSWDWDLHLLAALGATPNLGTRDAVVATALAIAFITKHMARDAETWELIVQKARDWLGQQHGVNVEKEISDAEKLLQH
ncbi:von Willebrand factor type A domain-containing protein [Xylaria bambusicola]|uniref:von Willebrand factor type A domain-containing protein n=1 Tax=Xylaria bambusicola TaxID=326684 RepID=UPI002008631D|nr:von Willebrand factor type A domain-containing protein [Xylaria bambusicola]KAI0526388.1 von Willebrand factor type A domain-containing protein [Xylaria bambusicola]